MRDCTLPKTVTELMEDRGVVEAKIDALIELVDEAGNLKPEDEAIYDTLLAESNAIKKNADRLQRQADVKSELSQVRDDARDIGLRLPDEEQANLAIGGWLKSQCSGSRRPKPDEKEIAAAKACGFNLEVGSEISMPLMSITGLKTAYARHKAGVLGLSRDIGESGGFFISETFIGAFEVAQLAYGGVLQVAHILRTKTANDLTWPSFDDEGEMAGRTSEGKTTGTAKDLTFQKTKWGAHKFETGVLVVSYESMRDLSLDIPGIIGSAFGERMGRRQSRDFTLGTGGADQAVGIVPGSVLGATTGASLTIDFDDLMELEFSIDPVLRTQGCQWMFNDATAKMLRLVKDGDGLAIWERSVTAGQPDRIFGYGIAPNYDMASPAADSKSVLFGKLDQYKVRQVGELRSYRATELYVKQESNGFLAFLEADGGVLNPSKSAAGAPIKHLKVAA